MVGRFDVLNAACCLHTNAICKRVNVSMDV